MKIYKLNEPCCRCIHEPEWKDSNWSSHKKIQIGECLSNEEPLMKVDGFVCVESSSGDGVNYMNLCMDFKQTPTTD